MTHKLLPFLIAFGLALLLAIAWASEKGWLQWI